MPTKLPIPAVALAALSLTIFTGCTKTLHDGVEMKGKTGFGAVLPQSGAYRQLGTEYFRGMKVAEATLNAGGGAEGKKVMVLSYESAGEREKGLDSVRMLTREFDVPFLAVALPRVADRSADEIAGSGTVAFRLEGGPAPGGVKPEHFVRAFVSGRDEADLMAKTLAGEKAAKVLVLACEDRYGDDAAARLAEGLAKAGVTPDRLPLRRDREAIAAIETAVTKTAYDAVCVFAHGPEIPPALYVMRKAGLGNSKIFGNHAFGGKSVTILDAPMLRGIRFTTPDFGARKDTPAAERFRSEYRRLNADEPDLIAALGYDQVMLAYTAAKSAETLSPGKVREKIITEKSYEGAAGTYEFDADGEGRLPLTVTGVLPADGSRGAVSLSAPFQQR